MRQHLGARFQGEFSTPTPPHVHTQNCIRQSRRLALSPAHPHDCKTIIEPDSREVLPSTLGQGTSFRPVADEFPGAGRY